MSTWISPTAAARLTEIPGETKRCSQCQVVRELACFMGRGGKECLACTMCRARQSRSKSAHKDHAKAASKLWRKQNPLAVKERNKVAREGGDWATRKAELGLEDKQVSGELKRKGFTTVDDVVGMECSRCKEWRPVTGYAAAPTRWCKIRAQCKTCDKEQRAATSSQRAAYMKNYEKARKAADPGFKRLKILRSKLSNVLNGQGLAATHELALLLDCSVPHFLMYLAQQFLPGMRSDNHGEWEIDHIRPCALFDLTDPEQQRLCFHHTNLQPLWAAENRSKGAFFIGPLPAESECADNEP